MAVIRMLRRQAEKQQMMDPVIVEQMVPEDHLLRKADGAVDFSFIHDLCAPLSFAEILLSGRSSNSFSRESMIALRVLEINVRPPCFLRFPRYYTPKWKKWQTRASFIAFRILPSQFGHLRRFVRFSDTKADLSVSFAALNCYNGRH